jgi:protoporphyrinogen/coproporphyrinogen III oxidase
MNVDAVVIGGGISGLSALRTLDQAGLQAVLLEASARIGGRIRTDRLGGVPFETGAEAIASRSSKALDLAREVGLGDEIVEARPGVTWLQAGGRLRLLPAGLGPAGPGRLGPVVSSGLLSTAGLARAGIGYVVTRRSAAREQSIGGYVRHRFGTQVVDRLVEPMVGAILADDPDLVSLQAIAPHLASPSSQPRKPGGPPVFSTIRGGLSRLAESIQADLRHGEIRTRTPVRALHQTATGWRVTTDDEEIHADSVVLAVPAHIAAQIIDDPPDGLVGQHHTSVAVVGLAYPQEEIGATGLIVGRDTGGMVRAATFVSEKWPHLNAEHLLVRASVGRPGEGLSLAVSDEGLIEQARSELADYVGLEAEPLESLVQRWPGGMPRYAVGHRDRVARIEAELSTRPGIAVTGASLHGLGVDACVGAGRTAAESLVERAAR